MIEACVHAFLYHWRGNDTSLLFNVFGSYIKRSNPPYLTVIINNDGQWQINRFWIDVPGRYNDNPETGTG